jgi:amino-acid N-acetyltransferase
MIIRPATIHDVPRVQEIINSHAELGRMLFKSYAQLFEALRDFAVCELEPAERPGNGDGRPACGSESPIMGCVALTIVWADLAEVRSLAVDEACRGKGIGSRLVEWCVEEARRLHIRKIFALTYEQRFFERLGFEVVAKESLPLKVWSDCVRCPKNDNCDETAVVKTLADVPVVELPGATPTPRGVSIPVLPHVED